jgi:NAD(P)-dependent dehydrogenase (short-subunit alcohol dehydrogenase family)
MNMRDRLPVCAIVGVGPGNGAALAHRFAREGYAVAMLSRTAALTEKLAAELSGARSYPCDVTDATSVQETFARAADELGAVDVLVYNVGKGVWGAAADVSPEDFEECWRVNTLGAFLAARAVLPAMTSSASGNIIFIGATASRRGAARAAAFASAKAGQRLLAESLARAYGPLGVHVSVIIVDGIVDEPLMRARFVDKPDSFFVKPDDISEIAITLTRQRRSAWSFELEARPFSELW